jgi:hypothetical protein
VTHILILQGTPTGAPLPFVLETARVSNAQQFGDASVSLRAPNELHPTRVLNAQAFGGLTFRNRVVLEVAQTRLLNAQTFGALTVRNKVVLELAQTRVLNASTVRAASIANLPFDPVNDETDALVAAFTASYSTTAKRQMDRLIHRTEIRRRMGATRLVRKRVLGPQRA